MTALDIRPGLDIDPEAIEALLNIEPDPEQPGHSTMEVPGLPVLASLNGVLKEYVKIETDEGTGEAVLGAIQELSDRLTDDVVATHDGEHTGEMYVYDLVGDEANLVRDALATLVRMNTSTVTPKQSPSEYEWLYDPGVPRPESTSSYAEPRYFRNDDL